MGFIRNQAKDLFQTEHWNVGVVHHPIHRFLEADFRPQIHWLPTISHSCFAADPFGLWRGDDLDILFEVYDYRIELGWISAVTTRDGRRFTEPREVLRLPTHLSYPFIVEHEGDTYCIPENAQGGGVTSFAASAFPAGWTRHERLIEGFRGLDSTIFQRDGLWWLFATDYDALPDDVLHAFYAVTPLGPWTPHAGNPIKSDNASSRPAGTVFRHEGRQYRPGQDCSTTYGGAVVIHEIVDLTPETFDEIPVRRVVPWDPAYPNGLHTISHAQNFTLVDGKRMGFTPAQSRRRLASKFRKLVSLVRR